MAIEIVDFPIKNGGSFHCYVSSPEGNIPKKNEKKSCHLCHGCGARSFCSCQKRIHVISWDLLDLSYQTFDADFMEIRWKSDGKTWENDRKCLVSKVEAAVDVNKVRTVVWVLNIFWLLDVLLDFLPGDCSWKVVPHLTTSYIVILIRCKRHASIPNSYVIVSNV